MQRFRIPCALILSLLALSAANAQKYPAALSGPLTIWVANDTHDTATGWGQAQEIQKQRIPQLDAQWVMIEPEDFSAKLQDAIATHSLPDVLIAFNATQQQSILQSLHIRYIAGPDVFKTNGWISTPEGAPHTAAAIAFLHWLDDKSSPLAFFPRPIDIPGKLSATEEAAVQACVSAATRDLGRPLSQRDHTLFAADAVSNDIPTPQLGYGGAPYPAYPRAYIPVQIHAFGNAGLAVALVTATEDDSLAVGTIYNLFVLHKEPEGWKILIMDPQMSSRDAWRTYNQLLKSKLDSLPARESTSLRAPVQFAPQEDETISRFPRGNITFQVDPTSVLTCIEWQFGQPHVPNKWSDNRVSWQDPSAQPGPVTIPAPFGVGKQPHRWRIWSFSADGNVAHSEWRILNFSN